MYKKGEKEFTSYYRPISLTAVVCKVMESIITYDILAGCLLRNFNMDLFLENAANPTYFMLNFLTKLIENGTDGDLVYFDLAQVFDSVSHNRLSPITLD